jgi:hypothetical protein
MAHTTFQVQSYHRLPAQCPAYVHNELVQSTGTVWNLFLDGCLLATQVPVPTGAVLELLLLLPKSTGGLLMKVAKVCWSRGQDCGCRFLTVEPRGAAQLQRYVRHHLTKTVEAE